MEQNLQLETVSVFLGYMTNILSAYFFPHAFHCKYNYTFQLKTKKKSLK
jgi:hypothetical protein